MPSSWRYEEGGDGWWKREGERERLRPNRPFVRPKTDAHGRILMSSHPLSLSRSSLSLF